MANKFVISIPMVSKSLKNTYNKQLEVYEFDGKDVVKTFTIRKGEMVEIFPKTPKYIHMLSPNDYMKSIPINELDTNYSGSANRYRYFDTLSLAMASKIYLLKELQQVYIREISRLEERLERNMPKGLNKLFENVEKDYAECFI